MFYFNEISMKQFNYYRCDVYKTITDNFAKFENLHKWMIFKYKYTFHYQLSKDRNTMAQKKNNRY